MSEGKAFGLIKAILLTGLLAGTLDIVAAFINAGLSSGTNPVIVLQFIASGVFGREAFAGGWATAAWGCLFHYIIATGWTTLFFLAYPKIDFLSKNKIYSGLGYAVFVWIMMTRVVLPLSNVPTLPFDVLKAAIAIGILMIAIGWPISFMAERYYSKP